MKTADESAHILSLRLSVSNIIPPTHSLSPRLSSKQIFKKQNKQKMQIINYSYPLLGELYILSAKFFVTHVDYT